MADVEIIADTRWRKNSDGSIVQIEPVLLNALRTKDGSDANWSRGVGFVKLDDSERYVYVLKRSDFLAAYELDAG